jgi:hypothetical protein
MKLTLLLAATAFFGVQELSAGVREFRSFSPPLNNTSGVQTNASDANNLSTRLLVNSSTKKPTCQLKKYL